MRDKEEVMKGQKAAESITIGLGEKDVKELLGLSGEPSRAQSRVVASIVRETNYYTDNSRGTNECSCDKVEN